MKFLDLNGLKYFLKKLEQHKSNGIAVTTDLPANITPTVKEALDTKSVQCLLAELLMKTGLY